MQLKHTHTHSLTDDDRLGLSGLSDAQWKTLVHMLDERNTTSVNRLSGKSFIESWIIYSGAINHMTGSLDLLIDVSDMAPVNIKLPDGRFTISSKMGSVQLGSSLVLQSVYFVDGLHCHLVSASRLTRDRCCLFQLTDKICIIPDHITLIMIGVGEQQHGLYFFRGM